MKKVAVFWLCLILCMVFVSCGTNELSVNDDGSYTYKDVTFMIPAGWGAVEYDEDDQESEDGEYEFERNYGFGSLTVCMVTKEEMKSDIKYLEENEVDSASEKGNYQSYYSEVTSGEQTIGKQKAIVYEYNYISKYHDKESALEYTDIYIEYDEIIYKFEWVTSDSTTDSRNFKEFDGFIESITFQ